MPPRPVLLACLALLPGCSTRPAAAPSPPPESPAPAVASHDEVARYCGACHAYPAPDLFPRSSWAFEVRRGFDFGRSSDRPLDPPDVDSVVRYYEAKAPESLPTLPTTPPSDPPPFAFARRPITGPGDAWNAATSFVDLVRLEGSARPSLLVCDLVNGLVLSGDPSAGSWTTLTDRVPHPGHAELADLDADGHADLLVADLGVPSPSDELLGQVVWLKGNGDGTFDEAPRTILTGVGRVADARAADFDGDGDLDVVAAVFGYLRAGGIVWLENLGPSGDGPDFRAVTIDPRHGAIHVPIVDLDADGRPDFVALISQEHETVVAYLNRGPGRFEPVELFRAPHPAFGSSGLDLADLDGDGDLDLLISNGDVYDSPLIKPYHGVSWLENLGDLKFEPRPLGPLYGAHRARAADLDGDGDLDVVASSFLAGLEYGRERAALNADAVVLFEQTSPGVFTRHALEWVTCDYPTLCLGDLDLDGDTDLLLGSFHNATPFTSQPPPPTPADRESVVVLENLAKSPARQ